MSFQGIHLTGNRVKNDLLKAAAAAAAAAAEEEFWNTNLR